MDVEVFKRRFLPIHPKLYRIAYALLGDPSDAEDVLQEAYCRLWNRREELEAVQNPEAFSVTLVKHLCLDFLRASSTIRRQKEEPIDTALCSLATDASPEKELEEKETLRRVRHLIELLPENQRQVIRLRGIEDCSFEEIEEITGLSPSNIRTLLSRARKWIRERLAQTNEYGR